MQHADNGGMFSFELLNYNSPMFFLDCTFGMYIWNEQAEMNSYVDTESLLLDS